MGVSKALTQRRIERLTSSRAGNKTGWHKDGATKGLLLQVTRLATLDRPPAANWVLRFQFRGTARWLGLGSLDTFTLEEARDRARKARQQIADGIDPVAARASGKAAAALEQARTITFQKASDEFFKTKSAEWKSAVHRQQYTSTMETYVFPVIGKLAVADIDTALILRVLKPHWATKTETMSRTRQRIEGVLAAATAHGYRVGDNPARWRGHLDKLLAQPTKIAKVRSHPALPYVELPLFMMRLRQREGFAARALEFTILTAARTNEVIGARWSEINISAKVWTVPADRMKMGKEHRVPLSDRALALLKALPREGESVFIGMRAGTAISNMAMLSLLQRMGAVGITVHGFRSAFKDWASERTSFANEVSEAALAHALPSKTEAAYRRGDLLIKRAKLMQAWADFAASPVAASSAQVIPLRG